MTWRCRCPPARTAVGARRLRDASRGLQPGADLAEVRTWATSFPARRLHRAGACRRAQGDAGRVDGRVSRRAAARYRRHDASADICRIAASNRRDDLRAIAAARATRDPWRAAVRQSIQTIVDVVHEHATIGADLVRQVELPEEGGRGGRAAPPALGRTPATRKDWWAKRSPSKRVSSPRPTSPSRQSPQSIARSSRAAASHRRSCAYAGTAMERRIVAALLEVAKTDEFWLGLYRTT